MNQNISPDTNRRMMIGVLLGFLAFASWGFLPLYWNLLREIPAAEVLAHRVIWSLVFVLILVIGTSRGDVFRPLMGDRRTLAIVLFNALIMGVNWGVFIWAVTHGYVLQSSFGYFINPLVSTMLGVVLLGERLSLPQRAAIVLAAAGCVLMGVMAGELPIIGLFLAISFAIYGYFRKISPLGSLHGLMLETLLLSPLALGYLAYGAFQGTCSFTFGSSTQDFFLMGAGVVTALPLLFFAEAARRIPLSTLGLLQYISPSESFLLAVFFYGEMFSLGHFISFSLIWLALLVFSIDLLRRARSGRRAPAV